MAYTRALQHWVEKTDPPAGGKPCLLAESVRELREELGSYLPFSNREVFKGLALPEETSLKEVAPQSMSTCPLEGGPGMEVTRELAGERESSQVSRVGKDPTPITTCGGCWRGSPSIKRSKAEGRVSSMDPSC